MAQSGPVPLSLADTTVAISSPGDTQSVSDEVISGCESVLGAGHCISTAAESGSAKDSTYYAEVTWLDPDSLSVRIRLFRGRSAATEIFERQVAFLARDTREQRQRAAGVVIAAGIVSNLQLATPDTQAPTTHLAAEPARPAAAPAAPQRPEKPKPEAALDRRPPTPANGYTWGVDGYSLVGSGLKASQPQLGLGLHGWMRNTRQPWRVIAATSFTEGPYEPRLTTWTFSLSIAACIEQMRWLEPRLGVELSHIDVVATAAGSSRSESAQLLRYGTLVGTDLLVRIGSTVALLASLEGTATWPSYDLWVADERSGEATVLGWRALVGLRVGQN